jgi:hypothetical protein
MLRFAFAVVCLSASSSFAQSLLLETRAGALHQIEQGAPSATGLAVQAVVGVELTDWLAVTGTGTFGSLPPPRINLDAGGSWQGESLWMGSFDLALRVTLFPSWNINAWASLGTGVSRGNGNFTLGGEPRQFATTVSPGSNAIPKMVAAMGARIRLIGPLLLNTSVELRTSDFAGVINPVETIESGSSMVAITAGPMLLF